MTSTTRMNILIGVSGGIAAYKIPSLIRLLVKQGHSVKVVMTKGAEGLLPTVAVQTLCGSPVYRDISSGEYDMGHIRLEEWADLFIIAPATANTIGKMACGIADNLLTSLALSVTSPIAVVPAMNSNMWAHPAVYANIKTLKNRSVKVLPVGFGELACGVSGAGRMIEVDDIASYTPLLKKDLPQLNGLRILISSGPTSEKIDPVRYITNSSSGQMGSALARVAALCGAEVTVVAGPQSSSLPGGVEILPVESADQMSDQIHEKFPDCDILIMAAAVSDFKVAEFQSSKIAREESDSPTLKLIKNRDIAASIGEIKSKDQKLVVFSLESDGGVERALQKMRRKGADFVVYNEVSAALGGPSTSQKLFSSSGELLLSYDNLDKINAAAEILTAICSK